VLHFVLESALCIECVEAFLVLTDLSINYLDASVSGGTLRTDQGMLVSTVGGKVASFAAALPVLKTCGRATHLGFTGWAAS
jgi:3-hydroxyisobutyrate dehydrogenase-like beta-hydroxyacid dehydrogenase